MTKLLLFLMMIGVALFAGCSKKDMSGPSPSTRENVIDRICKPWKLTRYTVGTDLQEYSYGDTALGDHALRTLHIKRDGSYVSANNEWSGTYQFMDDSTKIIF